MPPEAGPVTGDRLEGWRVLVPRAAHQAGDLSDRLRGYGARPQEVAMIAVRPPLDASPLERALTRLREGAYAWVVFTSTNAVRAVVPQMTAQGLDPRLLRTARVAAVGERTAAALFRLGVRVDLVPDGEQSAEGCCGAGRRWTRGQGRGRCCCRVRTSPATPWTRGCGNEAGSARW